MKSKYFLIEISSQNLLNNFSRRFIIKNMRTILEKNNWIDILSPTKEDIAYLNKHYKIHPVIINELEHPSARSKVRQYDDYLYLVLHFPYWDEKAKTSNPYEVDVILTRQSLITVRYQRDADIEKGVADLKNEITDENSLKIFYKLVEFFLEFASREMYHIGEKIKEVEKGTFSSRENKMVINISYIKRDILDFRRIFRWLQTILSSLGRMGPRVFGSEYKIYFDDLEGDSLKIENTIENLADIISSLEQTNNSLIQTRIDTLNKVYTTISAITWPTLLIISTYQMSLHGMPLTNSPNAYWRIVSISVIPSIFIYIYLKRKKLI